MYDTKMSMREFSRKCDFVFRCGYCALQKTFSFIDRDAYNAGIYGWNNNMYIINVYGINVGICTGYRNLTGELIPEDIISKHEDIAYSYRSITDYASYNMAMHTNVKSLALELIDYHAKMEGWKK